MLGYDYGIFGGFWSEINPFKLIPSIFLKLNWADIIFEIEIS
jgi:hypothetical protein